MLHELLRLDPLIDVFGHRLPNRFVDPRGGDTEVEIAAMAGDASDDTAVLIFPEGGNFSAERRARGIERLEEAGHDEEAGWAREMDATSPRRGRVARWPRWRPRRTRTSSSSATSACRSGCVSCGARSPPRRRSRCASGTRPPRDMPADRDAQIDWLFGWWRTLDAWVASQPTS